MAGEIGLRKGQLVKEKSDGSSGYWRIFNYCARSDAFDISGLFTPATQATDANSIGGWIYNGVGYEMASQLIIGSDWDGTSDIVVEVGFETYSAGVSGTDTSRFVLNCWTKADTETSTTAITPVVISEVTGTAAAFYKSTMTHSYAAANFTVGDTVTISVEAGGGGDQSDVTLIYNTLKVKYKTIYPAEEVA